MVTPPGFMLPVSFALNNLQVILFAALVGWAIAVRYDRPIHKRLMLIATLGSMAPAISPCALRDDPLMT
jgi:uncharacterized membrane protein YqgA involved in biofilm formation